MNTFYQPNVNQRLQGNNLRMRLLSNSVGNLGPNSDMNGSLFGSIKGEPFTVVFHKIASVQIVPKLCFFNVGLEFWYDKRVHRLNLLKPRFSFSVISRAVIGLYTFVPKRSITTNR